MQPLGLYPARGFSLNHKAIESFLNSNTLVANLFRGLLALTTPRLTSPYSYHKP